jgi:TonB family protein
VRKKTSKKSRTFFIFFAVVILGWTGFFVWAFFFSPVFQPLLDRGWNVLSRESRRILGWEKGETPPEEKRIREEVILKKMEEASNQHDWRTLAPEYPKPRRMESLPEKERIKILKESPEFKELDQEVTAYLRKKEDRFQPDLPVPSMKEATDITSQKDRGIEKVMDKLMSTKEMPAPEKPLEENLHLGIKGPLASRKILERPELPQAKVRMEAEIELTFYVTPSGAVDRVIPSVKGDAELERIATQYLKQWRFAPLSKDQPQVEQSGTIPIKFRLQ